MSCLNEVNLGVFIGPRRVFPPADLGVKKVPCSSSPGDFASQRKYQRCFFIVVKALDFSFFRAFSLTDAWNQQPVLQRTSVHFTTDRGP